MDEVGYDGANKTPIFKMEWLVLGKKSGGLKPFVRSNVLYAVGSILPVCGGFMRVFRLFCLIPFLSVAAHCQSLVAPPGCGPQDVQFSTSASATGDSGPAYPATKATVYVVLVDTSQNVALVTRPTIRVGVDGAWAGAVHGFTYMRMAVDAGEHHFCSEHQGKHVAIDPDTVQLLNFNAEAGKTYYLRLQVISGWQGIPFTGLQLVSADEGRFLVSQAALSISKQK